jgi:hypothetical protein
LSLNEQAMKSPFSDAYLDWLFEPDDYDKLVQIAALLAGAPAFESSKVDYGLGSLLFAFVESLQWFAQSARSGSWTYFESARPERQALLLEVLLEQGPPEFASKYRYGMGLWQDPDRLEPLDTWIASADETNNRWLWSLAVRLRPVIEKIIAA